MYNNKAEIQIFTFSKERSSFTCCECGAKKYTLTRICSHFENEHVKKSREEPSSFRCPHCTYADSDLKKVRMHVAACFQNRYNPSVAVKKTTVSSEKSSGSEEKSFCCEICQKRFGLKRVLLNHVKRFHLRKRVPEIACGLCSATFLHQHSLTVHRQTAHHVTGDNASLPHIKKRRKILHHFKCLTCSFYSFDCKKLKQHSLKCNRRKGVCPICKECFMNKRDFNFHIKTSHKEASSQRACSRVLDDDIKQILNFCKRTDENSESLDKLTIFLQRMKECFGSASCIRFSRYSEITEFMNSEFRPVYLNDRFAFKCCFCDHEHPRISGLTRHFKEWHMKIYGCKVCSLVYRDRFTLQEHRKTQHVKIVNLKQASLNMLNSFVCEVCGKVFSDVGHLKLHKKRAHCEDGENEYVCRICQLVFNKYNHLKVHIASHERGPFYCSVCGKEFNKKRSANHHEIMVHCPEEKKHQCQMCDYKAASAHRLSNHMNKHTREVLHECSVCGMRFAQKDALTRHQLTHTKEQKHSCPVCGQKFSQGCSMKRHLLTHDKIKPFQCGVCKALYSQLYPLKQHLKKKHPEADVENSVVRTKT